MRRVRDRLPGLPFPVLLVLAAGWWVFAYMARPRGRPAIASCDIYASSYPNIVYALHSLREGYGLLWNPLQNCGQPFPPATALSAFYPLHLVFLLADVDRGVLVIAFLHLVLAALGAYLLCREIGLGRPAAFCGAISLELGNHLCWLAGWHPIPILGSLVWLPWALLWCERILRTPTRRAGCWLAIVLALSLLAAFPQNTLFIYQLLALRIAWEAVTVGTRPVARAAGVLALGLLLPLALAAAQLIPGFEFAVRSLRATGLQLIEIGSGNPLFGWAEFRKAVAARFYQFWPGSIAFAALAPLGLAARATRRQAGFHALVVAVSLVLAIDGPVLRASLHLPLGRMFRFPDRRLWIAAFGAAMLTALGAQALARGPAGWKPGRALLVLTGAAVLWAAGGTGPPLAELWTVAGLAVLAAVPPRRPTAGTGVSGAGLAVAAVVATFTLSSSRHILFTYVNGAALLAADAPAFELLRGRMTPQDRFYAVAPALRFGLTYKLASMTGLPSIADYEAQTSRRFAELEVLMRLDRPMANSNDYNLRFTMAPRNRHIFDLLAARYLLVDPQGERLPADLRASLREVATAGDVVLYENPQAFPRTFYVPRAVTEADPVRRLAMIAGGQPDLHRTVILSAPPAAGAVGGPPGATGEVRIESDRAERVQLGVRAEAPGFVVLTDQDYPGWSVTVNGEPAPVLPANHAFRAVPVPAGESTVVWTYRPWSVWIGIGISLATLIGVAVALRRSAGARPASGG
jgi:Bacterial membrane protein YfhO